MFAKEKYQSDSLSHLNLNRQKMAIHVYETITSERNLLVGVLHMLLGMPSLHFEIDKSKDKPMFQSSAQVTQLLHLSAPTLRTYFEEIIRMGNNILSIKTKARMLYNLNNPLLRAFSEGLSDLINYLSDDFTLKLRTVQQESGNVLRSQQEFACSQSRPTTLLSLLIELRQRQQLIDLLTGLLQPITDRSFSPGQLHKIVVLLLNEYYRECDRQFCEIGKGQLVHLLFRPLMHVYFRLCQEWLEMNEATLALKIGSGFFLELQSTLKVDEQRLFELKRIVREDMVPQLFRNSYRKVIELGKTIQFIKLYFKEEQQYSFKNFMAIEEEFRQLHQYIDRLAGKQKQQSFFQTKKVQFHTISERLARLAKPTVQKNIVPEDNPYNMYPETRGVFTLKPVYSEPKQNLQSSNLGQSIKQGAVQSDRSINLQFCWLFDEVLERVGSKCVAQLSHERICQSIELTLTGIKKIMLFEQGDFIQQFIQLAGELLNRPSEKISRNNVERIIEEAVRSSGAQKMAESIRNHISFAFLRSGERGGVKGWRIFSLLYLPQRPTNCIFTARVMEEYGCISNLLFNLRHCEEVLVFIWQHYIMEGGIGRVLRMRNAVHHFVKALQSYLFAELEQIWNGLLVAVKHSDSLLAIIEANQNVLQQIKALTVENKALKNCLLSLIKVVDRFESIHKALESGESQNFKTDLDQIWPWFLGVLDQSRQIGTFSDTFDMRAAYSL